MMIAPKPVRDLADRLRQACLVDPIVEWDQSNSHWRITVANDRVVMTLDHKMTSGGRWVWASSTLSIDGVRGPITSSFEHFVRVWRNPEEMINRTPVPPPFFTPIEAFPFDSMPSEIVYAIRYVAEKHGLVASAVGCVDDNFWAAEFSFPRASIRLHWRRSKNDSMPSKHVYLIVDGEDKSDLAKGALDKALAIISQIPHPGVADPASIESATGPQRNRGVEVRDTHVMRN